MSILGKKKIKWSSHSFTILAILLLQAAVSILKQEYKVGETDLHEALLLALKVMSKTLDMTKLNAEKLELATLVRKDDKTVITVLPVEEVTKLIKEHEVREADAEAAKQEGSSKKSDSWRTRDVT